MSSTRQACILALIGLPGAGKTKFAQELSTFLSKHGFRSVIVSYDDLIPLEYQSKLVLMKMNEPESSEWKRMRKDIVRAVEKLLCPLIELSSESENNMYLKIVAEVGEDKLVIIIDDNNYYQSMRYEYVQVARQQKVGFCQMFIDTDLSRAIEQNSKRSTGVVPEEVIKQMATKLEPPNPMKNCWETFSFAIKDPIADDETVFEVSQSVVQMALDNPLAPEEDKSQVREASRIVCNASFIHQSDKMLRKKVSNQIQIKKAEGCEKKELETWSQTLNEKKQELLEDLKTGFAKVDSNVVKSVQEKKTGALDALDQVLSELFEMKLQQ